MKTCGTRAIALLSFGILICASVGPRADAAEPGATLEPKCAGTAEGAECWEELADKPGCHVWDSRYIPEQTVIWSGRCAGGVIVGEGALVWTKDGQSREWTGTALDGRRQGHWVGRFADGNVQEGPFVDGKRHGHWVRRGADGGVAEGPYVDGKVHGHWVLRFADGDVAEGLIVDGKRRGHWVLRFASGTVGEGPFVDGTRHGHWVRREADGDVQEGPFVDGTRHGHWVVRFASGTVEEGPFVDGTRHGHWVRREADGDVAEGPYVDGTRHGHWVERFADGGVAEGPYVDGKRRGHWVVRDPLMFMEGSYVDGKQHGRWVELISYQQGTVASCRFSEYDHDQEVDSGELPMSACPSPEAVGSSLRFPDGAPATGLAQEVEASLGLERAQREQIQTGLWALGFNQGPPDGLFGPRTREAIRNWQASRGNYVTGYLDADSAPTLLAAAPDLSGPIWITAQNHPCKAWNPQPEAGETLTWSGGCVDGKASGRGRQVWRNSHGEYVYEGAFREGKKNGQGTMTYSDGSHYVGDWLDNKRHGMGTSSYPSGGRYGGMWEAGRPHGIGTYTRADGTKYSGLWVEGCFKAGSGGTWTALHASAEACGFK